MENETGSDRCLLVTELTQIQEMVRQLEAHLDQPGPNEICKSLSAKILSSMDRSICMAKISDSEGQQQHASTDSPRSATGSPHSENSNQAFRDYDRREMSKKRYKETPLLLTQIAFDIKARNQNYKPASLTWLPPTVQLQEDAAQVD